MAEDALRLELDFTLSFDLRDDISGPCTGLISLCAGSILPFHIGRTNTAAEDSYERST